MTAAASRSPEPYEVPEGGLASFLTATVGDWSDEALNADNYYDIVKPTADQLAEFGREEDDRIAHVATGETIIPMAVFEEDPELKEALFTRMREMGIDPERYIVGNELNSINPVTGQPEFFLKKIFKGIKKAVKGVVKVFKKLAPIILSVGLNFMFPGLGTIAAGALGSGIGTLVQGGSLKDALKAAALGGAVGGLASGVGSVMQGGEFLAGVKSGLPTGFGGGVNPTIPAPDVSKIVEATPDFVAPEVADPTALTAAEAVQQSGAGSKSITNRLIEQKVNQQNALRAAELAKGPTATQLAGMEAPTLSPPAGNYITGPVAQKATETATTGNYLLGPDAAQTATDAATTGNYITGPATDAAGTAVDAAGTAADAAGTAADGVTLSSVGDITQAVREAADPGFFTSMKKFFATRNPEFLKDAFLPATKPEVIKAKLEAAGFNVTPEAVAEIAAELAPKTLRTYGPALAGLTVLGSATGAFDQPEMGELPDAFGGLTGQKLIDMYPSQYTLSAPGAYVAPSMAAADGGGIDTSKFPRRNGRISGPGTETSDDIPAMLSDGEFVMTAKAVRGAGNGSREAGMRNMYNMMSRFERNA